MHQYYDSDEKLKSNNFSYVILMILFGILAGIMIITSLYNRYNKDEYVNYEVVILNDNDVILYNVDNIKDSICLRLENSYALADEWMIQVKQ